MKGASESVVKRKDGFMRRVKDGEEGKNEMLKGAEEVFCSKGYEERRIMEIVKGVGIGKGSFYY